MNVPLAFATRLARIDTVNQFQWFVFFAAFCGQTIYSLIHSLDRLTGNGSLRPPDVAITSHVPSSICSEPDIYLQLADPGLSGTTSRTFPHRVCLSVCPEGATTHRWPARELTTRTKCFMRYTIEQNCLKKLIGSCLSGTAFSRLNIGPERQTAPRYRRIDRRTDDSITQIHN